MKQVADYFVDVQWMEQGRVRVKASSREEALALVLSGEALDGLPEGEFVHGTFEVDSRNMYATDEEFLAADPIAVRLAEEPWHVSLI